jgi:hypothetical protein
MDSCQRADVRTRPNVPDRRLVLGFMALTWAIVTIVPTTPARAGTTFSIDGALQAVAAISRTDVWAVGHRSDGGAEGYATLTEHFDGVSWHVVPSPDASSYSQDLVDVSGVSGDDVWAAGWFYGDEGGERALIEHWDGSRWTVVPSPDPTPEREDLVRLSGIDAISRTDVWAVGMFEVASSDPHPRTLIEHWDGSTWSIVQGRNPSRRSDGLNDVSAATANDVWAVGSADLDVEGALIEHWHGARWHVVPADLPTDASLTLSAVSALRDGEAWAVGYAGHPFSTAPVVEHWSGDGWRIVPSPDAPGGSLLTDVSAVASDDVWAVGLIPEPTTRTVIEHWDGSTWELIPSPDLPVDRGGLVGVSALADAAWAVGSYVNEVEPSEHPVVDYWNGATWRFLGPHARVMNLASIRVTASVRQAHPGDRVVFEAHASNLDRHASELWVQYQDATHLRIRNELCLYGPSADSPACEFSNVPAGGDVGVRVPAVVTGGTSATLTFCVLRVDSPTKACRTARIRVRS